MERLALPCRSAKMGLGMSGSLGLCVCACRILGRMRSACQQQRWTFNSGDSPELAQGLPYKGKSMRNRGVSSPMPFLLIPRSLLRGGFIGAWMDTIPRLFCHKYGWWFQKVRQDRQGEDAQSPV